MGWLRINMVAFVSAGLGLGHRYFDGYSGRVRSTRVLWWLQNLAVDDEYGFVATKDLNASEFKCTEMFISMLEPFM